MVSAVRVRGDERILENSNFVPEVLKVSEERLQQRYWLKVMGCNLEKLAQRVAELFGIEAVPYFSLSTIQKGHRYESTKE
jgi:hypothetical protein